MRLLKYEGDGRLTITSFDDDAIPSYAILSHTWGEDAEEVTFADLAEGSGKHKPGYEKIRLCGEQAQQDGLQYFWVDTCCIDKSDKAELSLAIRSMFRWYQDAAKCYVYLLDVSTKKRKAGSLSTKFIWELAFTLKWERLGDKILLRLLIKKITGIPCEALDGAPLCRFSVDERLRWKGDRQTKREEDAYEGAASAFKCLKDEIDKLEICVRDIRHTDPRHDKQRIEDTKGGLLVDSYCWVLDNTTF
ncbi:HET-domain-containing protein [Decorospora gaudefroyi]|uniref:HET-domain-containing protein n=1 Tax=Decorospora gaudefroyi TaxID=184978 RepID=A0A6A5JXG2_9PLEO|nr:HET-domain-containing protein [Decorospora gaudefroyi]